MLTALAIVAVSGVCAILASIYLWRSTRSGLWAMIAGVALAVAGLVGAGLIGWLLTRPFLPGRPSLPNRSVPVRSVLVSQCRIPASLLQSFRIGVGVPEVHRQRR